MNDFRPDILGQLRAACCCSHNETCCPRSSQISFPPSPGHLGAYSTHFLEKRQTTQEEQFSVWDSSV